MQICGDHINMPTFDGEGDVVGDALALCVEDVAGVAAGVGAGDSLHHQALVADDDARAHVVRQSLALIIILLDSLPTHHSPIITQILLFILSGSWSFSPGFTWLWRGLGGGICLVSIQEWRIIELQIIKGRGAPRTLTCSPDKNQCLAFLHSYSEHDWFLSTQGRRTHNY